MLKHIVLKLYKVVYNLMLKLSCINNNASFNKFNKEKPGS